MADQVQMFSEAHKPVGGCRGSHGETEGSCAEDQQAMVLDMKPVGNNV